MTTSPQYFTLTTTSRVMLPKQIEIRYYVVKDKIQDQTISLEHIRTKDMLADPLTKGLPPNVFKEHLAGMGLRESLMIPG